MCNSQVIFYLDQTCDAQGCDTRMQATFKEIDWEADETFKMTQTYDVIIGADIVYVEETFDALIKTLRHFSDKNTLVIMASKFRYERDVRFYELLADIFTVEEVFHDKQKDMHIYHCRLK